MKNWKWENWRKRTTKSEIGSYKLSNRCITGFERKDEVCSIEGLAERLTGSVKLSSGTMSSDSQQQDTLKLHCKKNEKQISSVYC